MTQKANIIAGLYDAFDYESVTVATVAIGFTSGTYKPSGASRAMRVVCTIETAQIRYRMDGTDPTSSEGHILGDGDTLTVLGTRNIEDFRAIRTGGTSGVIKATFER